MTLAVHKKASLFELHEIHPSKACAVCRLAQQGGELIALDSIVRDLPYCMYFDLNSWHTFFRTKNAFTTLVGDEPLSPSDAR